MIEGTGNTHAHTAVDLRKTHKKKIKGETAKGIKEKTAKDAYQLVITNTKPDKLCCS